MPGATHRSASATVHQAGHGLGLHVVRQITLGRFGSISMDEVGEIRDLLLLSSVTLISDLILSDSEDRE